MSLKKSIIFLLTGFIERISLKFQNPKEAIDNNIPAIKKSKE